MKDTIKNILMLIGAVVVIAIISNPDLFMSTMGLSKYDITYTYDCEERENAGDLGAVCSFFTPPLTSGDFKLEVSSPKFNCEQQFPALGGEGGSCYGSNCELNKQINLKAWEVQSDGSVKLVDKPLITNHGVVSTAQNPDGSSVKKTTYSNYEEWGTSINDPSCFGVDLTTTLGNQQNMKIGDTFTSECMDMTILEATAHYKGGVPDASHVAVGIDIKDECFSDKIDERPQYVLHKSSKYIPIIFSNSFSTRLSGGYESTQTSLTFYRTPPHSLFYQDLFPITKTNISLNTDELGDFEVKAKQFVVFKADYPDSNEEVTYPADRIYIWGAKNWTINTYKIMREEQFNPSDTMIPFEYPNLKYNSQEKLSLWDKILKWLSEVF